MVTWNQDISTQYHQNTGLLQPGEVATGGLAQQRIAAMSPEEQAAYNAQLTQFKQQLGTAQGPGGVVPATAEPLHAWEKTALTNINAPGELGGGNRIAATDYMRQLMGGMPALNPLATQYMEQAGGYVEKGAAPITFEEIEAARNPYAQALQDRLTEQGAQARQAIMAQQGQRGGRSFGDISTGRRDSYLDAEMLRSRGDIDYKTYESARDMLENERARMGSAGGMLGSLATGAQNITSNAAQTGLNLAQGVFNAGTSMTELQRDINQDRLNAGAYIRDYNQRINDLMGNEMLTSEADQATRLKTVQDLLKMYQSGQTPAVQGASPLTQAGGALTALGSLGDIFGGSSKGLTMDSFNSLPSSAFMIQGFIMPFNPTTNVQFQQGLAMMSGQDPTQAMRLAMAAQAAEANQAEQMRAEQTRQAMGGAIAGGLDNIDAETLAQLARSNPDAALQIIELKRKQQQQDRLLRNQEFMESLVSGGGVGNANGMSPYILSQSDDPVFRGIGEAQKAQLEEERKIAREKEKATLPGYRPVDGYTPTSAIVNSAAQMLQLKPGYDTAMQGIKKVLNKYGDKEVFTKLEEDEINQEFARLMNLERTVNNTGVLNVGEVPILEKNYATFNPLSLSNRFRSKDDMLNQAEKYINGRFGLIDSTIEGLGFKPTGKEYKSKSQRSEGKRYESLTPEQITTISTEELQRMLEE